MSSPSLGLLAKTSRAGRIEALQRELRARFPGATQEISGPNAATMSTGVEALDRMLPAGGLPRGQVVEWVVARSGGSATLLRQLVLHRLQEDEAVALVDAGRSLFAADWLLPASGSGLTFVRPSSSSEGPWCVELLLRAGSFSLVVHDGPPLPERAGQRLSHLAREAGATLLLVRPTWLPGRGSRGGSVVLRLLLTPGPRAPQGASMLVTLTKGGPPTRVEIPHERHPTYRLCAHPLVPDRRGGARRGRSW